MCSLVSLLKNVELINKNIQLVTKISDGYVSDVSGWSTCIASRYEIASRFQVS